MSDSPAVELSAVDRGGEKKSADFTSVDNPSYDTKGGSKKRKRKRTMGCCLRFDAACWCSFVDIGKEWFWSSSLFILVTAWLILSSCYYLIYAETFIFNMQGKGVAAAIDAEDYVSCNVSEYFFNYQVNGSKGIDLAQYPEGYGPTNALVAIQRGDDGADTIRDSGDPLINPEMTLAAHTYLFLVCIAFAVPVYIANTKLGRVCCCEAGKSKAMTGGMLALGIFSFMGVAAFHIVASTDMGAAGTGAGAKPTCGSYMAVAFAVKGEWFTAFIIVSMICLEFLVIFFLLFALAKGSSSAVGAGKSDLLSISSDADKYVGTLVALPDVSGAVDYEDLLNKSAQIPKRIKAGVLSMLMGACLAIMVLFYVTSGMVSGYYESEVKLGQTIDNVTTTLTAFSSAVTAMESSVEDVAALQAPTSAGPAVVNETFAAIFGAMGPALRALSPAIGGIATIASDPNLEQEVDWLIPQINSSMGSTASSLQQLVQTLNTTIFTAYQAAEKDANGQLTAGGQAYMQSQFTVLKNQTTPFLETFESILTSTVAATDSAIKVMEAAKKLAGTTGYALDAASWVGNIFAIICSAGSILALWNVNKKHMKEIRGGRGEFGKKFLKTRKSKKAFKVPRFIGNVFVNSTFACALISIVFGLCAFLLAWRPSQILIVSICTSAAFIQYCATFAAQYLWDYLVFKIWITGGDMVRLRRIFNVMVGEMTGGGGRSCCKFGVCR